MTKSELKKLIEKLPYQRRAEIVNNLCEAIYAINAAEYIIIKECLSIDVDLPVLDMQNTLKGNIELLNKLFDLE